MKADRIGIRKSSSVEDRVTLALREMLMHGEFVPGQKLVEAALAERLGVSRMPVRRALAVLERDGLVTNLPNRGSYVARFTLRQVNDARELRGSLEGLAARLVAERGLAPATQRRSGGDAGGGRSPVRRRHDLAERGGGLSAAQFPVPHRDRRGVGKPPADHGL